MSCLYKRRCAWTITSAHKRSRTTHFAIAGLIACSKTGLHPQFFRESFLMRNEVARTVGLIVLGSIASLAACQSGGTASKTAEITDPNTVFSHGGAHTNSATGTTSGTSSRRGRGLSGGTNASGPPPEY